MVLMHSVFVIFILYYARYGAHLWITVRACFQSLSYNKVRSADQQEIDQRVLLHHVVFLKHASKYLKNI